MCRKNPFFWPWIRIKRRSPPGNGSASGAKNRIIYQHNKIIPLALARARHDDRREPGNGYEDRREFCDHHETERAHLILLGYRV